VPGKIDDIEKLDPSALQAKFESARKAVEATPKDPKLESAVEAALRTEIKGIRDYAKAHPDDEFTKANQHLLLRAAEDRLAFGEGTWPGAGTVEITGLAWWALGASIMFPPPLGFLFGAAGGPDLAVGGFTSALVGAFVVDPAIIKKRRCSQKKSM
jgi:hypothetical protein